MGIKKSPLENLVGIKKEPEHLSSGLFAFIWFCFQPYKVWYYCFAQVLAYGTAIIIHCRTIISIIHIPAKTVYGDLAVGSG